MMASPLLRDERGVSLVEFALALPLLMLLGFGGIETARYMMTIQRVNAIAQTVADNAGRVRHGLDETDVNEIMLGAKLMGKGINFAQNGRVILSDLERRTTNAGPHGTGATGADNPNGYRQWIRWQRCAGALRATSSYGVPLDINGAPVTNINALGIDHGADETATDRDGMGPAGQQIAASGGTAVMFAEVVYDYQPMLPAYFLGPQRLRVVQAFNIRQRTDFSVYNVNALNGSDRADCRQFTEEMTEVKRT
jgi:hypothetical protein